MKRNILLFLFCFPFLLKGSNITSKTTGGNWSSAATWVGGIVPGSHDTAIINTTGASFVNVNISEVAGGVTINSGAKLTYNGSTALGVLGLFTNNGTIISAVGSSLGLRRHSGKILEGAGNWTGFTGTMYIWGDTAIIDASVNISMSGKIILDEASAGLVSVRNMGKITLTSTTIGGITNNGGNRSIWNNSSNSFIEVSVASWTKAVDILNASSAGNTVYYSGTSAYSIKTPSSSYYNLTIGGTGNKSMAAAIVTTNLTVNSGATLNMAGFSMNLSGNWTNNGTVANNTSTVTFNGSGTQIIGGTTSTTFTNLTSTTTGTVQLGIATTTKNLTVSSGTFDCQTFQLTGNAAGTMNMAANTTLLLGTTGSATSVSFPTNYVLANIALNPSSTVTYQANTASQVISSIPVYGNLIVSTGTTNTKTPSGTPLTIAGNLTVNSNATLSETTNTINLTGNATINNSASLTYTTGTLTVGGSVTNNGTLSFTTGTGNITGSLTNGGTVSFSGAGNLNIKGNFTNNSTFTPSTGTVTMNGSAGQSIGGTSAIAFNNLTIAGTGGETVSLTTNESFTNVLTVTSGTLGGASTMTLVSNSSNTAKIAQSAGSITAHFNIQRYESGRSTAGYISLSSAVTSTTVGDLNTSNQSSPNIFYMSGVGGPNGTASGYVSVKRYNEVTNNYDNITNYTSPGINYVFRQGEGLYMWLGTSLTAMNSPFTYVHHGVPWIGNVTSPALTKTAGKGNGFNILGNPYASPINWATFKADNAGLGLAASYYIFEASNNQWNAVAGGSISMCQGFGVIVSSAGTATFKETHKTIGNPSLLTPVRPSDKPNTITLTLSDDFDESSCPTYVSFGTNNVKAYDPSEDAYYIETPVETAPMLYTLSEDDQNLMINSLPDADASMDIPLTAIAQASAKYTLTISGLDKLTSYNCVSLIDKSTGQVLLNFENTPTYTFSTSNPGEIKNYVLHFAKLGSDESCNTVTSVATTSLIPDNIDIYSTSTGAMIGFHLSAPENAVVSIYNTIGEKVTSDISISAYDGQLPVNLASGQIYIVRVEMSSGVIIKKLYH